VKRPRVPVVDGQLLDGRYRIAHAVGSGGMGAVVAAVDIHLRRRVAIKFLHLDPRSETNLSRFENEAAALAAVRHDHVAAVYAFGHEAGIPYYVMELVDGENLRTLALEHARHGERIPTRHVLGALADIARALSAVHARSIVHRDVKPSNILIEDANGRAVLVDFGLAVHGRENPDDDLVGTTAFMAPEQIDPASRDRVRPSLDVYALACTAYDVLTGEPPFSGDPAAVHEQHLHGVRPRLSSRRPDLAHLDDLFLAALARAPSERPTALALARALELAGAIPPSDGVAIARAATALRVMVVDDDTGFARLAGLAVELALGGAAGDVVICSDAEHALREVTRERPDLLLLDYQMPGMDGLELLRRLRESLGGRNIRVIVASGRVEQEERWRFGLLGVADFVAKPVDLTTLAERITAVAARAGWLEITESPTLRPPRG